MPFNSIISRTDADALMREQVSQEILQGITETSVVMRLGRKLMNMPSSQVRMPVMSALPIAYPVSPTDTGLKQTTEVNWANKYIDAEEIAVIVPIPQAVLDDAPYDIIGEAKPSIIAAADKLIDQMVLYGTSIFSTWTTNMGAAGLIAGITAGSHLLSLANYTDLYEAVLGESVGGTSGLFGLIEDDGYMVTGSIAATRTKRLLRNCRDKNGQPIFMANPQAPGTYLLDGAPCEFPLHGGISSTYHLISGMWDKLVYAMRQDMRFEVAKEGVIQDANGAIIYNLFQQDMVALRCTMRLGFALPHPVTQMDSGSGFPFAALTA